MAIARQEVLARVIDPGQWIAEVFLDEDDIKRVSRGADVQAYLHGLAVERIVGKVSEIDKVPVEQLPAEALAARHGGFLMTTDEPGQLKPRHPMYRVRVALQRAPEAPQARLAAFNIAGERASLIGRVLGGFANTLVLQASF